MIVEHGWLWSVLLTIRLITVTWIDVLIPTSSDNVSTQDTMLWVSLVTPDTRLWVSLVTPGTRLWVS